MPSSYTDVLLKKSICILTHKINIENKINLTP